MDHQRLADLLKAYADNSISLEETDELLTWLAANPNHPMADEVGAEFLLANQHVTTNLEPYQHIASKILATDRPAIRKVLPIKRILPYAAAIALLMGVLLYNLLKENKQPATIANTITPATNGAILTRGDGQQINLDTLQTTNLGKEAGTAVKLNKGLLAYEGVSNSGNMVYNTIHTPNGRTFHVILQDGTGVWLNAGSSITYPVAFNGQSREVSITGEVYFDVANAVNQPFKVNIDNRASVLVLGTTFNINAYKDEPFIATTLLQGAIKMDQTILHPGQQATVNAKGEMVLKEVKPDEVTAWRNGLFHFENASIPAVMRQLARWYDVTVRFEGAPSTRSFSGEIGRDLSLQQVLAILETMKIHYKINNREIIITE
ncbi:FecR domain-containing protein [Chitinophaga sp.]|uniref:FecR family protein n=1 Tax=Chitinophaga sp. TaxID=1869181 RepID=UPI0031D87DA2